MKKIFYITLLLLGSMVSASELKFLEKNHKLPQPIKMIADCFPEEDFTGYDNIQEFLQGKESLKYDWHTKQLIKHSGSIFELLVQIHGVIHSINEQEQYIRFEKKDKRFQKFVNSVSSSTILCTIKDKEDMMSILNYSLSICDNNPVKNEKIQKLRSQIAQLIDKIKESNYQLGEEHIKVLGEVGSILNKKKDFPTGYYKLKPLREYLLAAVSFLYIMDNMQSLVKQHPDEETLVLLQYYANVRKHFIAGSPLRDLKTVRNRLPLVLSNCEAIEERYGSWRSITNNKKYILNIYMDIVIFNLIYNDIFGLSSDDSSEFVRMAQANLSEDVKICLSQNNIKICYELSCIDLSELEEDDIINELKYLERLINDNIRMINNPIKMLAKNLYEKIRAKIDLPHEFYKSKSNYLEGKCKSIAEEESITNWDYVVDFLRLSFRFINETYEHIDSESLQNANQAADIANQIGSIDLKNSMRYKIFNTYFHLNNKEFAERYEITKQGISENLLYEAKNQLWREMQCNSISHLPGLPCAYCRP